MPNYTLKGDRRGAFYLIKILDADVLHAIEAAEGFRENKLILGATYHAMLGQKWEPKFGETSAGLYWDFCIMGELGPIKQVRILQSEIDAEKVWIKYIDDGIPAQLTSVQTKVE